MKIFISHQKNDNDSVDRLVAILENYEIEYWVDKEQIYNQISDARKKIKEGLNNSTHFLLLYSNHAKKSKYVKEEVANALSKKQLMKFSFRLDNTAFCDEFKKFKDYPHEQIDKNNLKKKLRNFLFQKVSKDCEFIPQIRIFKDKVRFDFEHFSEFKDFPDNISVKSFKKFDTYNEFISQKCKLPKTQEEKNDILKYVTDLLKNKKGNNHNFIPIVGNYGSGKSLLSFYALYWLCEEICDDEIIPVYIPLGKLSNYRYSKESTLIESITHYVSKEYKITNEKIFCDFVEKGKITFILDALDEMSPRIDPQIIDKDIANVKKLKEKGNRVVLTSRYTYLTKSQETKFIYEDNLIEILDFDQCKIDEFVSKKIKNGKLTIQKSEFLKNLNRPQMAQFAFKPLFLQIICENKIENLSLLNPAGLFRKLTDEWIIHDVEKNENLDNDEKEELKKTRQRISESLALYANKIGDRNPIALKDLKSQVHSEFQSEIGYRLSNKKLLEFYKDAKDSTFLIKEKSEGIEDTFSFIHRAVIEYLVARRLINCINRNSRRNMLELILQYSQEINTNETFEFIDYLVDTEWSIKTHIYQELESKLSDKNSLDNYLDRSNSLYTAVDYAKNKSTQKDAKLNPKIGNLISILYSVTNFGKFKFKNKGQYFSEANLESLSKCNLEGARLPNAILPKIDLTGANLSHANLEGANLEGANLSRANLEGANLSRANLEGARLEGARLYDTNFMYSNLVGARLRYANLLQTNLRAANLERADLSNVNRERRSTDWESYDAFYDVDLSLSNISNVRLHNARLPYAIIINPADYNELLGDKDTDFSLALVDDSYLLDRIKEFTDKAPEKLNSKKELAEILNKREEWPQEERWTKIAKIPDV